MDSDISIIAIIGRLFFGALIGHLAACLIIYLLTGDVYIGFMAR